MTGDCALASDLVRACPLYVVGSRLITYCVVFALRASASPTPRCLRKGKRLKIEIVDARLPRLSNFAWFLLALLERERRSDERGARSPATRGVILTSGDRAALRGI